MKEFILKRNYECNSYDKAFSQEGPLWEHERIYAQAKVNECSECDKEFALISHLQPHTMKSRMLSKLFGNDLLLLFIISTFWGRFLSLSLKNVIFLKCILSTSFQGQEHPSETPGYFSWECSTIGNALATNVWKPKFESTQHMSTADTAVYIPFLVLLQVYKSVRSKRAWKLKASHSGIHSKG